MERPIMFKLVRLVAMIPVLLAVVSCSSMDSSSSASTSGAGRPELEQKARDAYRTLVSTTPKAGELATQATAVLIFPDIVKAGFLVGAQGGDGVMFGPDGKVMGYYNATALSYGLQAGVQSFHQALFLMKPAALNYLNSSDGWSVGMGPSVVVVDKGKADSLTTTTLQSDVYAFIYGQEGLMAGLGVQGQKITRIKP
jgi:lipid-binding SYLF domain-containing protein